MNTKHLILKGFRRIKLGEQIPYGSLFNKVTFLDSISKKRKITNRDYLISDGDYRFDNAEVRHDLIFISKKT